ncbi:MAG: hypothetical protein ACO3IR_06820 [Ilumatobacteraceae bacterium]
MPKLLRALIPVSTFLLMMPISSSVAGGPQTPSCGTYKVLKNETIAGQAFPKGTYVLHAIGLSCKKVIGKKGLFAKFLNLPDNAALPRPWIYLAGAIGAPKFSAGQGIGFRAPRISP